MATTYTVTYNANGGTGAPQAQTKVQNVTLKLSSTVPTRSGYRFQGWAPAAGASVAYQPGDDYTGNASLSLWAVWTQIVYVTLTYDANGGTGAPASVTVEKGSRVRVGTKCRKATATVTRTVNFDAVETGATLSKNSDTCTRTTTYKFKEWNMLPNGKGTKYAPGDYITLTADTTLHAMYTSTTTGTVALPTGTYTQHYLQGFTLSLKDVKLVSDPYAVTKNGVTLYAVWSAYNGGMLRFSADDMPAPVYLEEVGAKVRIVGFKNPENDGVYTVAGVDLTDDFTVYFEEDFKTAGEQDASENELRFYGVGSYVPDFDYICSSQNRLWGCSSRYRNIYASALGDPTDFDRYQGDSLDSYAVPVGTAGDFTGCIALNNFVLFFKQHTIHKMLGSYPAEYALYTYDYDGVSESNWGSLISCDGTAVFIAEHGIQTYAGASTGTLSKELGEGNMYDARAGYNGEKYMLYFRDEDDGDHSYEYDMRYGLWLEKDFGHVLDYAHLGDKDYVLIEEEATNTIYQLNTGVDLADDWEITYREFIEMATASKSSGSMMFEKKRYTDILFNIELPVGSNIVAEIFGTDGIWHEAARMDGSANGSSVFKVRTPRVDRLSLRLTGHGPVKMLGIERDFIVKSRR